jgi:hypothetical protein
MRTERLGAMGAALLLLGACGAEEEAEVPEMAAGSEPTEVAIEADAPGLPPAAHGGTVLAAGDHHVEVVAEDDGYVNAFVLDDEPPPPAQTQITVRVPADDGETHPVVLIWDPGERRYRGRLRRARPVPGPVEVTVVVDGDSYRGRAPRIVVVGPSAPAAPRARVEVERPSAPRVDVEVDHPEPPRAEVRVRHPEPPRAEVRVRHPGPPRPHVEVRHPSPPGARVEVRHPGPPGPRVRVRRPGGPRVRVRHDNGRRARGRPGRGRGRRGDHDFD